jgi:hypothetical protein
MDVKKIIAAYLAGEAAAVNLQIGDVFTGAFGAAKEHGHDDATQSIFTSGYLDGLHRFAPGGVVTDQDGRITEFL